MALTTEATTNLPSAQQPSGWTDPTTTIVLSAPLSEDFETTIAAAGVTHASNASTGLTQLIAAVKTWIDNTYAPNTLKLDTAGETIDGIITITSVQRGNGESTVAGKLYISGTDAFTVKGAFKYE